MTIPSGGIEVFKDGIGFVKLVEWMGDERAIVNAARVSFHKEIEELDLDTDVKLINWLMKKKHGSPFEQGFISRWHIRLPIFVMREWVRHRIGISLNEESGRYVELRPDFYTCEFFRTQQGKPGAYTFAAIDDKSKTRLYQMIITDGQEDAWERYQDLLAEGVAKEVARQVLPLNIYTEIRYVFNCRSLLNFLELRNHPEAQWEIQQYAGVLEECFANRMPHVYEAFYKNGRIAP